jgi:hypothetical protein
MPNITSLPAQGTTGWYPWAQSVQTHTHTASELSDSTLFGRGVLLQADAAGARAYLGASNLQLGASSTTAAAGNHTHLASSITDFAAGVRQVMPNIRLVTTSTTVTNTDDLVRASSTSLLTVTLPSNAATPLPVGFSVTVRRVGTGGVTIAWPAGVTVNGAPTGVPQNGSYFAIKVGTDEWDIEGGQ